MSNTLLGRSKTIRIPKSLYRGNKNLNGNLDIAQDFNDHFGNIAPNLLKKLQEGSDPTKNLPSSMDSLFLFQQHQWKLQMKYITLKVTRQVTYMISQSVLSSR